MKYKLYDVPVKVRNAKLRNYLKASFSEEIFPKISLLKVNFKIFFRRKICVGQSHFTNFSFRGKFSGVEMGH